MYNSFIYLLNTYCKWSSHSIIKEINPEYSLAGRTDDEAEASVLWPLDVKSWLIRNNPDAGKDWRQEEKGTTEDKMVGWHHQLNGHEFEQALGDSEGEGRLACCSPWGCTESDTTEQLYTRYCSRHWGFRQGPCPPVVHIPESKTIELSKRILNCSECCEDNKTSYETKI